MKMFNLNNKNIKSTLINGVSFDNNNFGSLSFDGTKTESFMDNLNISGLDSFSVNIWFYSNTSSTKSLSRDIGNAYILNYNSGL